MFDLTLLYVLPMFCIICYNNLPINNITKNFCNRVVSFATSNRVAPISLNTLKGRVKDVQNLAVLF